MDPDHGGLSWPPPRPRGGTGEKTQNWRLDLEVVPAVEAQVILKIENEKINYKNF